MIPIVCIDDSGGILFNHRRVSNDAVLVEWIKKYTKESSLWIRPFSEDLFHVPKDRISEDCLLLAEDNDFCFIEDIRIQSYCNKFSKIIVCKWNRNYPSDFKFEIIGSWNKHIIDEIKGKSHEKITIEEWERL